MRGREGEPPPAPEPLLVEVVDAHCHLDIMGSAEAVAEAVSAAQAVGVRRVVTIGVDVPTSQWSAEAAAAHPDVYAGVAIHPNEAYLSTDEALDEIARLARLPRVRAVGETGLDYFRDTATPKQQQHSFRRHIAIAKESGKALVIHDRDAHDDVLRILLEEGAPDRTVFHCYSGDAAMARVCADAGYYLSFAGTVTFKNAQNLRDAVAVAPLDLLLVETDAPFLTPMPYRGAPNAPYLIPLTVRAMAEAAAVPLEAMCTAIAANSERVFGPW
ncbi:TatD family hydrolase [Acidothermaceae bacterium B102]|nr:TatD family hydrolase [Acidothermaceae bacterium B102]